MIKLEELTLTSVVENAARAYPRLTAARTWRVDGSSISYPELLSRSMSIAHHLVRLGLKKGQTVAILGENCPNWGLAYMATNRAGGVAVPILPNFSEHEVKSILEHSESVFVVVNSAHVRKVLGGAAKVIRMEDMFFLDDDSLSMYDGKNYLELGGVDLKGTTLSTADASALESRRPTEEDIASIIYTSGTTGTPKAVMLTNRNIVWNAYKCSTPFIKIHPGWGALSILPMSHVYEFTIGYILLLINGVQIVYLGKAPSTDSLMPALKEVQPEIMLSVPLLIEKIYRRALLPKLKEGTKLGKFARNRLTSPLVHWIIGRKVKTLFGGRLRFFGVGGAAFDGEAEKFFHKIHFPYALGYGLTETSPFIAGCGPKDQVVGTLGPVLDGLDAKLDPANGELLIKGPSVMKGYYKAPELNGKVFTEDGYLRTGDIGKFVDGRLVICGRCKTMILGPSGENIYPENIEFLINSEELVVESLVLSEDGGLTAMIRLDMKALKKKGIVAVEAIQETLDAIKAKVNSRLASFSKIRKVEIQETPFERTPTDKIKRFKYEKNQVKKAN